MLPRNPGALSFWVNGATDARNPSMEAVGVNSNATGSRADDADFDDIEVPKNIKTPEARLNLRQKIEESTHILVPGWQKTFVGTPHTHDSIYTEQIEGGAAVLKIPLFEHVRRYTDTSQRRRYRFDFPVADDGLYVIAGIYKFSRMLVEGRDYHVEGNEVVFDTRPATCSTSAPGCAWPERFNREEISLKRQETRTLNAWDSQYQLEAKPISEVRLDPARIVPYDCEPVIRFANGEVGMWLGATRIVGATAYWDCSLGKIKSDASAFTLLLTDARGNSTGTPPRADRGACRVRRERPDRRRPGHAGARAGAAPPDSPRRRRDQRAGRLRAEHPAPGAEGNRLRGGRRVLRHQQAETHPRRLRGALVLPLPVGARLRAGRPGMGSDEGLQPRAARPARRLPRQRRRGHCADADPNREDSRETDRPLTRRLASISGRA